MSVTAPAGLRRRRGRAAASRRRGAPDLALVATADGRPVAGRRPCSPRTWPPPRRCRSAGPTWRPPAAGPPAVVLNSGNANAATGAAGPGRRRARCAPPVAAELGCAARRGARLLDRPHRHPAADRRRSSAGIPALVAARATADGGAAAAEAIMTTDTRAQGGRGRAAPASPSAAWPRARRCSPRTWPRCWPCSPPTPPSTPAALQRLLAAGGRATRSTRSSVDGCTSTNDTVHRCWPAARPAPVDRGALAGAVGRGVRRPGRADGRRRRGRHQGRARRRSPARPTDAEAARRRPARWPSSQLVQVLAVRRGPLLGPRRQRARLAPASPSTPTASPSPTAASSCAAGGVAVAHDAAAVRRPHGRPARSRSRADLGLGDGRARSSSPTTSPTPTSTRT